MVKNYLPSFVWTVLILLAVGMPGSYIPVFRTFADWLQWDKIIHLILFGGLTILLLLDTSKNRKKLPSITSYCVITLCVIAFGGCTEWLQSHVFIGRDGNLFDFYANSIGVLLALVCFLLLRNRAKKVLKIK